MVGIALPSFPAWEIGTCGEIETPDSRPNGCPFRNPMPYPHPLAPTAAALARRKGSGAPIA